MNNEHKKAIIANIMRDFAELNKSGLITMQFELEEGFKVNILCLAARLEAMERAVKKILSHFRSEDDSYITGISTRPESDEADRVIDFTLVTVEGEEFLVPVLIKEVEIRLPYYFF